MLKNYFKIAMAVLRRRKFFTFISLFVISFTLAVLMVLAAFIDKIINDDYPDRKRDRSLYINKLQEVGSKTGYTSINSLSFSFLTRYVSTMRTPEKVAISSNHQSTNTYVNNKKISVSYKYTDANYWDVTEYVFTEGGPYTGEQIRQAERVAVISEDLKRNYFGDVGSVVGKYIEADNVQYRVRGVVKNVAVTGSVFYSDLYLPYTVSKMDYKGTSYQGPYTAVLLARTKKDLPRMRAEYEQVMQKIPYENKDFDKLYSHADTYLTGFLSTGDEKRSGLRTAVTLLVIFIVFFMLLPTLNLININVTRIMERSSEIGVRKAFGASSGTLVYQFLVENIILTLLGGLIGVVLAGIIVYWFNRADLIANVRLALSPVVLLWGLLACVVFGFLSGVYPAWRMSRFSVITALRS